MLSVEKNNHSHGVVRKGCGEREFEPSVGPCQLRYLHTLLFLLVKGLVIKLKTQKIFSTNL